MNKKRWKIFEFQRKFPAAAVINRVCTKEYTLSGTNITLKYGDEVYINVYGIHRDPKYYPDPEKFNPENFSKESKAKRHP